jgi:hypothetical protein
VAEGPVRLNALTFQRFLTGKPEIRFLETTGHTVTFTFINNTQQKEDNTMSDAHARMRVTLDLPVDPSTASERVMKAIAGEARDYVQVVLVKDREVTLTDHVEVINVHVHRSTEAEACEHCVRKLAMDERQ